MPTNHGKNDTGDYKAANGDTGDYPHSGAESAKLGYETTDVNVGGVAVFLAGLLGFVLIFFFFCYFMGKYINTTFVKQDGPNDKWHQSDRTFVGAHGMTATTGKTTGKKEKLDNLESSSAMQQAELNHMTQSFPGPRLQTDDGNQDTADLHAKEDLLLDHYSNTPGQPGIRIPFDQAMRLIVQRQLPVATVASGTLLAGDKLPVIAPPLTSGFARTGYELDAIEARAQKMSYGKAEEHAELRKVR